MIYSDMNGDDVAQVGMSTEIAGAIKFSAPKERLSVLAAIEVEQVTY